MGLRLSDMVVICRVSEGSWEYVQQGILYIDQGHRSGHVMDLAALLRQRLLRLGCPQSPAPAYYLTPAAVAVAIAHDDPASSALV
jgi:hypothetical protein